MIKEYIIFVQHYFYWIVVSAYSAYFKSLFAQAERNKHFVCCVGGDYEKLPFLLPEEKFTIFESVLFLPPEGKVLDRPVQTTRSLAVKGHDI